MPRAETVRRRSEQERRYRGEVEARVAELRTLCSEYDISAEQLAALMGLRPWKVESWLTPLDLWPHGLEPPRTRQMDRLRILVESASLFAEFAALRAVLLSPEFGAALAWYDACRRVTPFYRHGDPPLSSVWPPPLWSRAEIAAFWREQRTAHFPPGGARAERLRRADEGYRAEMSAPDPWAEARRLLGRT